MSRQPKSAYRYLISCFIRDEKADLLILLNFGFWIGVCSLIIPISVQLFVNTIGFGLLLQPIFILSFIVFSVLIFSGLIESLKFTVVEKLQSRLFANTALKLAYLIPRVQGSFFQSVSHSDSVNRLFELPLLQKAIAGILLDGITIFLQVIFGLLLVTFYHPLLLVLNCLTLIIVSFLIFWLSAPAIKTSISESKSKHDLISWLGEVAKNTTVFSSAPARKFALKTSDHLLFHYTRYRNQHYGILFRYLLGSLFLKILVNSLLLSVGGFLIMKGQLTVGQLVASEMIVSSVLQGIGKLIKHFEGYYDLVASLDKIAQVFNLPLERADGEILVCDHSDLHLKKKLFQVNSAVLYNPQGQALFQPLFFQANKGDIICLQGPAASGKSRLFRCFLGLDELQEGYFSLYEIQQRYYQLEALRQQVHLVSGIELFQGSILENIRIFSPDLSLIRIQETLVQLGMYDWVSLLSDGLNTRLSGKDYPLSQSQAEKIVLLRALVSDFSLILIDHICFHHEKAFWKSFFDIAKKNACVIFSQSEENSLNAFCSKTVVLKTPGKKKETHVDA